MSGSHRLIRKFFNYFKGDVNEGGDEQRYLHFFRMINACRGVDLGWRCA